MHILRIRDFGFFIAGRFVSVLAAQVQWVAVGWYLYDLTGSALTLAFAGLASFVPIALLTLPAGDLSDRIDRRWLLAAAHLCQAMAAALLLVLVAVKATHTSFFYAALVLSGCTRALSGPASKSLAPLLVPREQLAQSVAWGTSAQQIAIITGPALGGLIYLLGAPFTFAVCTVLALLAAFAMVAIRTKVIASKEDGTNAVQRAIAGFRYLLTRPVVFGAITLDLFAVLLGGVAAFGAGAIVFALSHHIVLSMIALALMGAGDSLSVFVRATIVQLATPQDMRGRVSAIHVLFVGCTNELGEFRAGLFASLIGAAPAAMVGGIGTLVIVTLWMRLFPQLRRVNRLSEVAAD